MKEVSGWRFSHPLSDLLHLKLVFSVVREMRRCICVQLCGRSAMQLVALISVAFDGHRWNVDAALNLLFMHTSLVTHLCLHFDAVARGSYYTSYCGTLFCFPTENGALLILLTSQHVKCCLALVRQCAVFLRILLSLNSSVTKVPEKYGNAASMEVCRRQVFFFVIAAFFFFFYCSVENAADVNCIWMRKKKKKRGTPIVMQPRAEL